MSKVKSENLRNWMKTAKLSDFKKNFWRVANRLSEDDVNDIKEIINAARKKKLELSYQSVLYHIKEYLSEK